MKEKFKDIRFNSKSLELIETANAIVSEYRAMGFRLSLRQLYYQLVARDYIENTVQSYKRVGNVLSDARDAGLMDWNALEDRGRVPYLPADWESPAEIVRAAANGFRLDRWRGQRNYVELMVEKDALSGILRPVCSEYHVRFSANKGYSSSTAMYDAAKRFAREYFRNDRNLFLIYLGDHDPSGIDMTRDITDRLCLYGDIEGALEVKRIALNMDQIETWNPPPNPAKETDSRFAGYRDLYGETSWELDAIEARTLAGLVREEIGYLIDWNTWEEVQREEEEMRSELQKFADDYEASKNGQQPKKKGRKK